MKKIRTWQAAKELGVSSQEMMLLAEKHHWFCTINENEFNKIKEKVTMKKHYVLNVTKIGEKTPIDDIRASAYNYLSKVAGFEGADITFAFPANNCQGREFFEVCQEYTRTFDDENALYKIRIYEYTEGCEDVNIHDGGAWVELNNSYRLREATKFLGIFEYLDEDINKWTDILLSREDISGFNEAIFKTNSSQVKLVEEVIAEYGDGEYFFSEFAKKYDLILDQEEYREDEDDTEEKEAAAKVALRTEYAHLIHLKDGEWKLLDPYLDMDLDGFIRSKRTGKMLTHKELEISLNWVNKRRA